MNKVRLDQVLVAQGLAPSRSQAESTIKRGKVMVNGAQVFKPGHFVTSNDSVQVAKEEQFVSRAGLKLASVVHRLGLQFIQAVVLDVGSSTGGFTDYALKHGAKKVIAVDVGTNQMHSSLRSDPRVELHEQTDIRNVTILSEAPNIVVIDVSFISVRDVLPHIATLVNNSTKIVAMVKPQFESGSRQQHKGVVKNETQRRQILADFELWVKQFFVLIAKADSEVAGAKGNKERFYVLKSKATKKS